MSNHSVDTAPSSLGSPDMDVVFDQFHMPQDSQERRPLKKPRSLVLCFDGTGNEFSGKEKDTNVVKLLSMLDRNDEHQYHYYQTGIGTYDVNETSIQKSRLGEIKSKVTRAIDQGFGTTFDSHVVAGYRFLMRYYEKGDKIYIFGFSRGAYTAKFLSRMVHAVGLLCRGNEEMVPFAYRLYQRHMAGELKVMEDRQCEHPETLEADEDFSQRATGELEAFSDTFCWKQAADCGKEVNIKVFFLGLWDCVNSVAVIEGKTSTLSNLPSVQGTAHHIRHAVAVDERRVKFKPALFEQDRWRTKDEHGAEDIKEVWFPGNHGDIGGGWDPVHDRLPTGEDVGVFARLKAWLWRREKEVAHDHHHHAGKATCKLCKHDAVDSHGHKRDCAPCQLSDIPLAWMIKELEEIGGNLAEKGWHDKEKKPYTLLKWRKDKVDHFKHRCEHHREMALMGSVHDPLRFGFGTPWYGVLFWRFLENCPFIARWELKPQGWVWQKWPVNGGDRRDIPEEATLHHSLIHRLQIDKTYKPMNNHGDKKKGGSKKPCLAEDTKLVCTCNGKLDPYHATFNFKKHANKRGLVEVKHSLPGHEENDHSHPIAY
ncbi:Uncharacterized protein C8035_v010879 [Colletotrichum spinosum]|uniref:T6SS Phospholipase effector Tle1-like catalytic domain-containing protein n=1 Tax=Colletotrichum spinosum TaxID=1347390 RepID=A0A4R8Q599_9PEZI|nr:Uncharacterized protein C8035_v010879 [Colletotrichum spinosum]